MTTARPFLKWVGGKAGLLDQLWPLMPDSFGSGYHEPFVGAGAMFFKIKSIDPDLPRIYLNDLNAELIRTYHAIADVPQAVINWLKVHEKSHCKKYYYEMRARDPRFGVPAAAVAGRMIYLNKTCFNGLYRVNKKGLFNTPMGRYEKPSILDEENIRAVSKALWGVMLSSSDFEVPLRAVRRNDFVYLDPPYDPISKTANFTSYTKGGFGRAEQERLASMFELLALKKAKVMLSQHDTPLIRKLYKKFRIEKVSARRSINSKGSKRGPVGEVVVLSYDR